MGCVYLARNRINGKCYVGKTINTLIYRIHTHVSHARKGLNTVFANAIRKYGVDAFQWSVLFESDVESKLFDKEIKMIHLLNTHTPNGYNLTDGGDGPHGYTHSKEARTKISIARKGWKYSKETRDKISATLMGRTGRKHSKDTRVVIGEASKAYQDKKRAEYIARIRLDNLPVPKGFER